MSLHLQFAKQTYIGHLKDSFYYSFRSFKASFYFFIHGIFPDIYTYTGSEEIYDLNNIIIEKYDNIYKL